MLGAWVCVDWIGGLVVMVAGGEGEGGREGGDSVSLQGNRPSLLPHTSTVRLD